MTDLRATIDITYTVELPDDVSKEDLMTEAEAQEALIEELVLDRENITIEHIGVGRELLEDS